MQTPTYMVASRLAFVALSVVFACGGSPSSRDTAGSSGTSAPGFGGVDPVGGSSTATTLPPYTGSLIAEVYAHSDTTLYRLDPVSKALTVIGPVTGCVGTLVDIAMDKNASLFGTTFSGLYRIDKATAVCTPLTTASAGQTYPNGLSFLPEGTRGTGEALVGFIAASDAYLELDTTRGSTRSVGNLGGGFTSSGDVVAVKDGITYATVKGAGCNDCLVELDPKTGSVTKNWGPLGYEDVWGLAQWAGTVYGFTKNGDLIEITFTGDKLAAARLPIPNAPFGVSFYGAASSTLAPTGSIK